jgi:hypothetical protein
VPGARARVCDLLAEPEPAAGELGWATDAVCSEVLEHVDDPVALLRNARAWLGSGARLVVTVPGGPMSAFDHHIGHRRHFTPADLAAVISAAGLEVVTVGGAGFPFFNVYRLLVISRGEQLIDAARNQQGGNSQSALLRAGQAAFDPLFRLTLPRSRLGWQTVGVARNR